MWSELADADSRFAVMDVGTGRQALALLNLGARHVSHFDGVLSIASYSEAYHRSDRC